MKQRQKRHLSLSTSITFGIVALAVLTGGTISILMYINFRGELIRDLQHRLVNIASIATAQINGDELATLISPDDMRSDTYMKNQEKLFDIVNAEDEILYIYTMRQAEDGTIYFYLNAGRNPSIAEYEPAVIGEVPYEQPTDLLLKSFASPDGTVVEPNIYNDKYGSVISAYSPIYKSNGTLEGFLGIDVSADNTLAQQHQLLVRSMLWFLIPLPVIILLGWLLGNQFARPTVELTKAATRIAGGNLEPIRDIPSSSWETFQLTQAFNLMAIQLRELVSNLEHKIAERTLEAERRTQELETASRIARDAIVTQDLDTLLSDAVSLIRDGFNLYHTSIFLADDRTEYVILRAASGEAGQKLLEQNIRFRIGENSIVARVAGSGYPRIAMNVETDSAYLNHPLLPDSRSEMALPLIVNKRVIGVLDIQSDQQDAFDDGSLRIMQTLADQIAVSIENARLVKRSQDALDELSQVYHAQVRSAWARQAKEEQSAYSFDGIDIMPVNHELPQHILSQLQAGHAVAAKAGEDTNTRSPATLLVPLMLRGQLIGMVGIEKDNPDYTWSTEEIAMAENAATQTVISLENARLLEEAQKRAALERSIGEIASKIGASTKVDAIMQSTVREIGKQLGDAEVILELESDPEITGAPS